jgi:phosphatidylethanolamine N-methyltransferase
VFSTPAATEGETATETETEPETDVDDQMIQTLTKDQGKLFGQHSTQKKAQKKAQMSSTPKPNSKSRHQPQASVTSLSSTCGDNDAKKRRGTSQHDLLNKYFRRDAVVLRNVDLLRYVD